MEDGSDILLLKDRVRSSRAREIVSNILKSRGYAYACLALNLGIVGLGAFTAAVGVTDQEPLVAVTGGAVTVTSFAVLQNIANRMP